MVTRSITQPGSYSSGTPMAMTRDWKRNAVRFSQLESIQKRLAALESRKNTPTKDKQPDDGYRRNSQVLATPLPLPAR